MHNFMRVDAQSEVPSADRWLGASESGRTDGYGYGRAMNVVRGPYPSYVSIGVLVVLVLGSIAVAYGNNDEVIGACGDGLRQIVLAHVLVSAVCIGIVVISQCCLCCFAQTSGSPPTCFAYGVVCVIVVLCVAVLGGLPYMAERAYTLSKSAWANPECVDVLKRHSAGIKSELLAIMAFVYFILDMIPLCAFGLLLVIACVFFCVVTFCGH
jgi:hypothetical protein